jgi:hypothetical protein
LGSRRRVLDNGNHRAARADQRPGTGQGIAANEVEDKVDTECRSPERLPIDIDELVGAQLQDTSRAQERAAAMTLAPTTRAS